MVRADDGRSKVRFVLSWIICAAFLGTGDIQRLYFLCRISVKVVLKYELRKKSVRRFCLMQQGNKAVWALCACARFAPAYCSYMMHRSACHVAGFGITGWEILSPYTLHSALCPSGCGFVIRPSTFRIRSLLTVQQLISPYTRCISITGVKQQFLNCCALYL